MPDYPETENEAVKILQEKVRELKDNFASLADYNTWYHYGFINPRLSEDKKLLSLCYNRTAQENHHWNIFERICRGLTIEVGSGSLVARPFSKFFNYGEKEKSDPDSFLTDVRDKLDGFLVICFYYNGEWRFKTKNIFDDSIALKYKNILPLEKFHIFYTYLFECIDPARLQVVNYDKSQYGMYLLAIRETEWEGNYLPPLVCDDWCSWHNIRRPKNYTDDYIFLKDILHVIEDISPFHQEGFVVTFRDGHREKIKSSTYNELHRMLTKVNLRTVQRLIYKHRYNMYVEQERDSKRFEYAKAHLQGIPNTTLYEVMDKLPEIHRERFITMAKYVEAYIYQIETECSAIFASLNNIKHDRKEFAITVTTHYKRYAPYLFGLLDNKYITFMILHREDIPTNELEHTITYVDNMRVVFDEEDC